MLIIHYLSVGIKLGEDGNEKKWKCRWLGQSLVQINHENMDMYIPSYLDGKMALKLKNKCLQHSIQNGSLLERLY